MKSQHDQTGSAHSSPLAGRRRMPAAGPSARGQHQQQVLVTEENLSDKEVYPSGYMSIPQIGKPATCPMSIPQNGKNGDIKIVNGKIGTS